MQGIIRPQLSKLEIANRLKNLARNMRDISSKMAFYGDYQEHWESYSKQLLGASEIVRSWVIEIKKELADDTITDNECAK
jgi:hypothetical protein